MTFLIYLIIVVMGNIVLGVLIKKYRVKLKTRYILTITLSTVLFVIYISLPDLTRYGREARIQHVAGRDKVANLRKIQFHESISESKNLEFNRKLQTIRNTPIFHTNAPKSSYMNITESAKKLQKRNSKENDQQKQRRNINPNKNESKYKEKATLRINILHNAVAQNTSKRKGEVDHSDGRKSQRRANHLKPNATSVPSRPASERFNNDSANQHHGKNITKIHKSKTALKRKSSKSNLRRKDKDKIQKNPTKNLNTTISNHQSHQPILQQHDGKQYKNMSKNDKDLSTVHQKKNNEHKKNKNSYKTAARNLTRNYDKKNTKKHEHLIKTAAENQNQQLLDKFAKDGDFLYQLNMNSVDREKYFFDIYQEKKLLFHLSPEQVKTKLFNKLTWWELVEIVKYPRVWYVGENAKDKLELNESNPDNFGFDIWDKDDGAVYQIIEGDHLEYRYEILKHLGAGSFGSVVEARDHALSEDDHDRLVAIKIMHNDSVSERYFKREIGLMKMIYDKTNGSERFSTVVRTFFFRNHFCYVMELMNGTIDVTEESKQIVDLNLLRKYALDIFNGLVVLHKENILHGDLKPSNLLLVQNCNRSCSVYVKLADFTFSCLQSTKDFRCSSDTITLQTKHYRAPEICMKLHHYPMAADVWSVGVTLAKLYMGEVPFSGESNTDQLAAIMEVLGLIPPYIVKESPHKSIYQKAVCYTRKNGFKRMPYRKSLQNILKGMPEDLYDLIKKCLELDYRKRITAEEALKHRFLTTN